MRPESKLLQEPASKSTRRDFLKWSGKLATASAAGSALAGMTIPHVHAAEDHTIRLALIGSGSRGSGATVNAFESSGGPVKLVAMADLFQKRLDFSHKVLSGQFPNKVDVPRERQFIGFDAYRKAIDCLRPGDVAMLTGYAGFRPQQLEYAVEKGINVFMEKSFAVDPPAARRVIKAGEAAKKKNLKIAAGLMCRHSRNRQELIQRIRDGEMGQIELIRAYRMEPSGPIGQKPVNEKELFWQIRNFTKFLWVSGGLFAEMDIHQIDEICWIKDAYPVSAHGIGGRAGNNTDRSQNLDSFSIEWTFPDGTKAYDVVRYIPKCYNEFATFIHGTRCAAQFSGAIHAGTTHLYKDQRCSPVKVTAKYDPKSWQYKYSEEPGNNDNIAWKAEKETITPWQAQWNDFLAAIRNDQPFNQAERAAMSNLADMMGRAAVHSGKVITWDEVMASKFQFCPDVDHLTDDSAPPIQPDAEGRYPLPIPGVWSET